MDLSEQQTIKFLTTLKELYCQSHGITATLEIRDKTTGEVKYSDKEDMTAKRG